MAFFDWNHDGKKNYIDNAIEMMIINDIEAQEAKKKKDMSYENYTPEWGVGSSGKKAYKKGNRLSDEDADKVFQGLLPIFILFGAMAAVGILIANIIGFFDGYVSWLGIVISIVVLIFIIKWIRKRFKKRCAKRNV